MPLFQAEGHNAKATSDTGTLTIAITVPASLTNAHADIAIRLIGAPTQTLSGVTYNGSASGVTFKSRNTSATNNFDTWEHWYISLGDNPTSGSINVVATPTAACRMIGYVRISSATHQTTPLPAADTFANESVSDQTITQTVSSAIGELVVDAVAPSGGNTISANGANTGLERTNYAPSDVIGGSEAPGAASVVMSWHIGASDQWSTLAWRLAPAPDIFADKWHPEIQRQLPRMSEIIAY